MTVLDTSGVVDFLLGVGAAREVEQLLLDEGELASPDVVVFETVAVLRRLTLAGELGEERAAGAVSDLGDLPLRLYPSLLLRERAWELRANLTTADAVFVALAELLNEPLATKDRGLSAAVGVMERVRASVLSL